MCSCRELFWSADKAQLSANVCVSELNSHWDSKMAREEDTTDEENSENEMENQENKLLFEKLITNNVLQIFEYKYLFYNRLCVYININFILINIY